MMINGKHSKLIRHGRSSVERVDWTSRRGMGRICRRRAGRIRCGGAAVQVFVMTALVLLPGAGLSGTARASQLYTASADEQGNDIKPQGGSPVRAPAELSDPVPGDFGMQPLDDGTGRENGQIQDPVPFKGESPTQDLFAPGGDRETQDDAVPGDPAGVPDANLPGDNGQLQDIFFTEGDTYPADSRSDNEEGIPVDEIFITDGGQDGFMPEDGSFESDAAGSGASVFGEDAPNGNGQAEFDQNDIIQAGDGQAGTDQGESAQSDKDQGESGQTGSDQAVIDLGGSAQTGDGQADISPGGSMQDGNDQAGINSGGSRQSDNDPSGNRQDGDAQAGSSQSENGQDGGPQEVILREETGPGENAPSPGPAMYAPNSDQSDPGGWQALSPDPFGLSPLTRGPGEDDGWELHLLYYDSETDHGETALLPEQEIIWDATESSRSRTFRIQIHYKNEKTERSWQPGELMIECPDLRSLFLDGLPDEPMAMVPQIAADPVGTRTPAYDWSYVREPSDSGSGYVYRFYNNVAIEEQTNCEGSIQISWPLVSSYGKNCGSFDFSASMQGTVSESIHMSFTSTVKQIQTKKEAFKLVSGVGLPAGDYIWVRYVLSSKSYTNTPGVRHVDPQTAWFEDELPDGCLVLNLQKNPVQPYSGNIYRFAPDSFSISYSTEEMVTTCYVGYPRQPYGTMTLTNVVTLWGGFFMGNARYGEVSECRSISSGSAQIAVADFAFTYTGDLYGLTKKPMDYRMNTNLMRTGWDQGCFRLGVTAVYDGTPVTLRVGDDLAGILYNDGAFRLLEEGSYHYRMVRIPVLENFDGQKLAESSYTCSLYIRRCGSPDYVLFQTLNSNSEKTFSFSEEDEVAGWYVEFQDLHDSLRITGYEGSRRNRIVTAVSVHDENVTDEAEIFNFAYLRVFMNGAEIPLAGFENYSTQMTQEYIASRDMELYGTYLCRDWASVRALPLKNGVCIKKTMVSRFAKDDASSCFRGTAELAMQLVKGEMESFNNTFYGYEAYDLLPAGVEIVDADSFTVSTGRGRVWSGIRTMSGRTFSQNDYLAYVLAHSSFSVIPNWRQTGRTMVRYLLDYTDDPMDLTGLNARALTLDAPVVSDWTLELIDLQIRFPLVYSYDSYLEYGREVENLAYLKEYGRELRDYMLIRGDGVYSYLPGIYVQDQGEWDAAAVDINENGITDEYFVMNSYYSLISETVSTHQDVLLTVQTDQTPYTSGTAYSTELTPYTYKLRVRTGSERVTNLVLYDSLEAQTPEQTHWRGSFAGVDTSYALAQGYHVKVYYSSGTDPGNLEEDASWLEYSSGVDPAQVRSLAFLFADSNGANAVIPATSLTYVLITMQAPTAEEGAVINRARTRWNAITTLGETVPEITGIQSNQVSVLLGNQQMTPEPVSLLIRKEIRSSELVLPHGNVVSLFRIEGTDLEGTPHTWYRALQMNDDSQAADGEDGFDLCASDTVSLPPGRYRVSEEPVIRYSLSQITGLTGGTADGQAAVFDFAASGLKEASVTFRNTKTTDQDRSHTALVRNVIG